ncbi:MAG: DNA polymerase III subunit beta [Phycisphaerales bacterium]
MKVICDRSALMDAVNLVSGVVASRSPRPQLTCIKFEARKDGDGGAGTITLSATDAEISIRMSSAQAEVQEEGDALIPADKLRQIVSAEDKDPTLTIDSDGEVTHIRGADAHFKVYGYPPADFPQIPDFPSDSGDDTFAIDAATLSTLIIRTTFSTARENSRYAINGVLMRREGKKIEMVATDGRRLALAKATASEHTGDNPSTCIIPTKALTLANKLLGSCDLVRVAVTDNQIVFKFDDTDVAGVGGTVLASNLVDGTFPPYQDVIPKDQDKRATFSVESLGSAVRRAALLTNEESRGVRMAFGRDTQALTITSRAPEMGEAEISVEMKSFDGDDIEIGFNPAFIIDALKVLPGEEVMIEMKAPNKPGMIKSGSDFVYVVMPVNLQ